jgi:hypothetical protein
MSENSNSSNKTLLVIMLGFISIILLAAIVVFASYVSDNNYGASVEAELKAARDDNKNILAQYQQKILEATQVPEMYKNDFKEVLSSAMTGRYGPDGSKATMQWIQENNLKFDSSMYNKLQDMIAAGRKDFEKGQTRMIDIRRGYETQLGYFWRGTFLRMAGFPKLDLKEYEPVITQRTEDTFKNNKEDAPLKLR